MGAASGTIIRLVTHGCELRPNHSLVPWKITRIFDRRGFRRRGNAHLPAIQEAIQWKSYP